MFPHRGKDDFPRTGVAKFVEMETGEQFGVEASKAVQLSAQEAIGRCLDVGRYLVLGRQQVDLASCAPAR